MKYNHILLSALTLCASGLLAGSCGSGGSKTGEKGHLNGSTTIACDASFRNIMQQEIQVFEFRYNTDKTAVDVLPYYLDEADCIDSIVEAKVRLACISRPLSKKQISYLKNQHKRTVNQEAIAVDAVALIVNPKNPMEYIDHKDLVDILTGKYTTWDKIVPNDGSLSDIKVVFDGKRSSMVRYMTDSILDGASFGPNVYAQNNPEEVFDVVAKDINAIGVIGVSWLTHDLNDKAADAADMNRMAESDSVAEAMSFKNDIKVLGVQPEGKLESYLPYQQNIYSGDYPYYRQIYLVSTGAPHSVSASFYTFVTSYIGQKIILMTGICPKTMEVQLVDLQ